MNSDITYIFSDYYNEMKERGLLPTESEAILMVGNCLLLEIPKGLGFSYRALAVDTYHTKHLFNKTQKLERTDHRQIAAKIRQLPFYNELVAPSLQQRAIELLTRIITSILPQHDFSFRQAQLDLSLAIMPSRMPSERCADMSSVAYSSSIVKKSPSIKRRGVNDVER